MACNGGVLTVCVYQWGALLVGIIRLSWAVHAKPGLEPAACPSSDTQAHPGAYCAGCIACTLSLLSLLLSHCLVDHCFRTTGESIPCSTLKSNSELLWIQSSTCCMRISTLCRRGGHHRWQRGQGCELPTRDQCTHPIHMGTLHPAGMLRVAVGHSQHTSNRSGCSSV